MSFPKYPTYKDSGVAWLGDVPEHWAVRPLKYNLYLLTEKTERRDNPVALENIEGWTGRLIPTETEFQGEGVAFSTGDILFGKLRPYLAKVYRAESSGEAVGDFHVMRPVAGVDGRFAQYEILSREFIDIVDGSTFGSKMPRASWESVGGMKVATPPYDEQIQIARTPGNDRARGRHGVLRHAELHGQVVAGADRNDAQPRRRAGEAVHHAMHRAVAARRHHEIHAARFRRARDRRRALGRIRHRDLDGPKRAELTLHGRAPPGRVPTRGRIQDQQYGHRHWIFVIGYWISEKGIGTLGHWSLTIADMTNALPDIQYPMPIVQFQ